jgi:cytohesin
METPEPEVRLTKRQFVWGLAGLAALVVIGVVVWVVSMRPGPEMGSPLHQAAARGKAADVSRLLAAGADPNAVNDRGQAPLHLAATRNEDGPPIVAALVQAGARVNAADSRGATPLIVALMVGRVPTARALLDAGADAVAPAGYHDLTPLHITAAMGEVDLADVLLRKGATLAAVDDAGATPLHFAAREGQTAMVTFLLDRGALINARMHEDQGSQTPLAIARAKRHQDTARALTARGGAE